ncbi:methyltransferase, FxLD system [Actinomadura violacea]|uniref:Protein-L-isoaspartate O-methyltransferase n=1 Tax=Actinomadura violacea TaxID=2819934 RepID=A0ABS3RWS2_9ACTN|nr:methyltransferase, FxLD system [Actinomadura violacea]MBO2461203.1 methyltransferase, FxLD system [Actinomadura violacea]
MSTDTVNPDSARARLVKHLTGAGDLRTPAIRHAFSAVPRHLFVPGTPLADAYADKILVTKRDVDGTALSSASQPSIVAHMLEQAQPAPGARVLEIGAGTGYNAALLRELVGERGHITTIDVFTDVADDARRNLTAAGYDDVDVLTGDGAAGAPDTAPFDLIVVTAGAWDVPAAWWAQLAPGGRIVVPLRWRGLTRSLALDHQPAGSGGPAHLVSRSMYLCGFIPMSGTSDGGRTVALADNVTLLADQDQPITTDALTGVLDTPRSETWSGVVIPGDQSTEDIWLRMSITEPGTCRIHADGSAIDSGRVTPATRINPALADGDSIAYLASRRVADGPPSRWELGAIGHGPRGAQLADRIAATARDWDRDRDAQPRITLYPADTPDEQIPAGLVIDKRDSRMVFSW